MSYNILFTNNFKREAKKLAKKYPSLKSDIANLITNLEENPFQGFSIGKNCYKIRITITSKNKGKSAGARVIYFVIIDSSMVFLLSIYDKSDKVNISEKELFNFISQIPD